MCVYVTDVIHQRKPLHFITYSSWELSSGVASSGNRKITIKTKRTQLLTVTDHLCEAPEKSSFDCDKESSDEESEKDATLSEIYLITVTYFNHFAFMSQKFS